MTGPARAPRGAGVEVEASGGLPAYLVRRHPRARRVRLRVTPRDGLVVTLPPGARLADARHAVRAHLGWAERHLADTEPHRAVHRLGAEALLPDEVSFAATGERWVVHYAHTAASGVRVVARDGTLTVSGDVADADACLDALRRWLARAARERLVPMLEHAAEEQGLPFAAVTVRAQRTRWGSCSRSWSVSLNRALVFLEPVLVRCVMAHELVHTVRHDHSPAFWAELERREPGCGAARRALREAWRCVPPWADAS